MRKKPEDEVVRNQVIELPMMNVPLFIALSSASGFMAQTAFYPLLTIRTRIQVQKQVSLYRGSFHALTDIVKKEGFGALYGGFWIKCAQLVCGAQFLYILTYEGTRTMLSKYSSLSAQYRAFFGGAMASFAAQTIVVPVDVISQHLQLGARAHLTTAWSESSATDTRMSNRNGNSATNLSSRVNRTANSSLASVKEQPPQAQTRLAFTPSRTHFTESGSSFGATRHIVSQLYHEGGLLAFYRGYVASVLNFVPNSALWWFFYDRYCDTFVPRTRAFLSDSFDWHHVPQTPIKCLCGSLAGASAAVFTNVLDCIRVRMQVQRMRFVPTVKQLYAEEGVRMVAKGLTARLLYSGAYSFFIILGYEPIKKFCLKPQFAETVNW